MTLIDADALIKYIDMGHLRSPYEKSFSDSEVVDMLEAAPTVEAEPTIIPIGVVKEYDNGMVAMRKETYHEYHARAVNEATRRLTLELVDAFKGSE